jgi:hypothetical protein
MKIGGIYPVRLPPKKSAHDAKRAAKKVHRLCRAVYAAQIMRIKERFVYHSRLFGRSDGRAAGLGGSLREEPIFNVTSARRGLSQDNL